jgi:hypothetical protein
MKKNQKKSNPVTFEHQVAAFLLTCILAAFVFITYGIFK